MAKHKFQKGNQAAKGRLMPEGLIAQRRLTRVRLEEILHKYLDADAATLKGILKEPGATPAVELMIISILARAMSGGDVHRAEFLINRILGKVPDVVHVDDARKEELSEALAEQLIAAAKVVK